MTPYLPYVFGLINFFGGLCLFLLSFRLYKPKQNTEEQKERYEKSLEKFGTLMKVCSIILILNGAFDLIKPNPSRYSVGNRHQNFGWTSQDRVNLLKNCMLDAEPTATNHPEITKEFCKCSVNKIMKAMSRDQLEKSLSKSKKEVIPIFQDCIDELNHRIDGVESQRES